MDVAVITGHQQGQVAALVGHAQAAGHLLDQMNAAFFMAEMPGQDVGRGCRLAQVVGQAGKAHGEREAAPGGLVDHHQGMDAGVDLRMVVGRCGTPNRASTSGSKRASAPHSRRTSNIRDGRLSIRPLASSCQTRSATR